MAWFCVGMAWMTREERELDHEVAEFFRDVHGGAGVSSHQMAPLGESVLFASFLRSGVPLYSPFSQSF